MSHKKSNDHMQAHNALDRLKWEAAKEVAIEGEQVQEGRLLAPEEHETGQGDLKAAVDRAEESIARDSGQKAIQNLNEGNRGRH